MCKKNEEISAGKIGASEMKCMALSTDCLRLNHDYNFIEIGNYIGKTAIIDLGNKKLHYVGGILVDIEEEE